MLDEREYWVRNLADVTKQCSKDCLIATLIFKDNEFPKNYSFAPKSTASSATEICTAEDISEIVGSSKNEFTAHAIAVTQEIDKLSENDKLIAEIEVEKEKIITFQDELNSAMQKLQQVLSQYDYVKFHASATVI